MNGSTNAESKNPVRTHIQQRTVANLSGASDQGRFYGHEREQVARILIQGLQDLGYHSSAQTLTQESGYQLESEAATDFRDAILSGRWKEAEALLPQNESGRSSTNGFHENGTSTANGNAAKYPRVQLTLRSDADRDEMLFLIRQQKYLELLEQGDVSTALVCLRQELHALHQDQRQLHALSSLIMCQSPEEVKHQAAWDGANGSSRKRLLSNLSTAISPSVMLRDHRLAHLLNQWKDYQIDNCLYHNSPDTPSLYVDHSCTRNDFPLDPVIELDHHTHEVWFVRFSNNGQYVATAGKDCTIAIYDTSTFKRKYVFSEHRAGVACVAWSPDDQTIVSCSLDYEARLWDLESGRCSRVLKLHKKDVTCAAWAPDGSSFVLGSHDLDRPLSIWSASSSSGDSGALHVFDKSSCSRVQDCAVAALTPRVSYEVDSLVDTDAQSAPIRLVAMCVDGTVHVFDYNRRERLYTRETKHILTSVSLSQDGQEMLVNLNCNEVWALGVVDGLVRQKYSGQQQGNFIIRGCYGGASEGFVVSGGEGKPDGIILEIITLLNRTTDGRICVWRRHSGRLLEQFEGHSPASANTVAWNRANPRMFASAGDDCRVRIWAALNSQLTQTHPLRDTRQVGNSLPQISTTSERSVPQWGSTTRGNAPSALTAALMRQ